MRIVGCWLLLKISLLLAIQVKVVASFAPVARNAIRWSASSASSLYDTPPKKQNLSASSRARREEDERRLERKDDVVIGKTSAKRGASDFALNPKSTEEQWMKQASRVEQQVFKLTEEGMEAFKMVRMNDA